MGALVGPLVGTSVGNAVSVVGGCVSGVGAAEFVGTLEGASETRTVGAEVLGVDVGAIVDSTISWHVSYSAKAKQSNSQAPLPSKQFASGLSWASRPVPSTPPTPESSQTRDCMFSIALFDTVNVESFEMIISASASVPERQFPVASRVLSKYIKSADWKVDIKLDKKTA